jgi:hypothetical protein
MWSPYCCIGLISYSGTITSVTDSVYRVDPFHYL